MTLKNEKIKICVSSTGQDLESEIDPRFGRCEHFLIVDIDGNKILNFQTIKNIGFSKDSGAGIGAAEQIGKLGVNVLITGDVGPKANEVLKQLEIEVYKSSGNARVATSEYLNNEIARSDENISLADKEKKEENKRAEDQRIFIPLMDDNGEASKISLHFGHAPYFGLYDISAKQLTIKKNKLNHSSPEKTPVDQVIEQVNPTIVYAQDMGTRAVDLFTKKNILLKTGPYKTVKEIIKNIDKLEELAGGCGH